MTKKELQGKLDHLREVLKSHDKRGILITMEGAMRWLTGIRHQIIDIAPDAASPVNALVMIKGSRFNVTVITDRIEMPRVKDQVPAVFKGLSHVSLRLTQNMPAVGKDVLTPRLASYGAILGQIVRPVLGGSRGNAFKKLDWLANMTVALLAKSAHQLKPGMNGAQARGLLFRNFADYAVESNLFLVSLKGQENHLHPLYDERYKVKENSWIKLVTCARYIEHIFSSTVMVKLGGRISKHEHAVYHALQDGAIAYADCYRNGASEKDIYTQVGKNFRRLERQYGLKGFARSAYLHHMGGPTSPIGNRDYVLAKGGKRKMFANMQFALNPVDVFHSLKVEIQGMVTQDGPPVILDTSKYTPEALMTFRTCSAAGGTKGKVADLILRT